MSEQQTALKEQPVVYGEIVILGYNGSLPHSDKSKRTKSKFSLCKRPTPNGIRKSKHYIVKQPQATKAIQDKELHSISYTISRGQAIIVEYQQDHETDMFQIGRSSESPIDFVVIDTVNHYPQQNSNSSQSAGNGQSPAAAAAVAGPNSQHKINCGRENNHDQYRKHFPASHHYHHNSNNNNNNNHSNHLSSSPAQSTISRFACRILVDRKPPYTARIYAAGFDSSKNIFLGEKATKWEQNNEIDGLTTNGVLIMHPKRGYFAETNHHVDSSAASPTTVNRPNQDTTNLNNKSLLEQTGDHSFNLFNHTLPSPPNSNKDNINQNLNFNSSHNFNNNNNNNVHNDSTKAINITTHAANLSQENNIISGSGNQPHDTNNNSNNKHNQQSNNSLSCGVWREVSVDGGVYAIRESRSAAQKGTKVEGETNVLQDGTLIDLCGATLLWRSMEGLSQSPTKKTLEKMVDRLNASRPQCPVGLNTLVIPKKPISCNGHHHRDHHPPPYPTCDLGSGHQPYVYIKCGHVQGSHDWGATKQPNQRTCPICFSVGLVAKLSMGIEPSFYVDCNAPTHVFNPCGHMASEKTVEYWSTVKIPHGTHFFHSICPFCATPVATNESKYTKLIFQDYVD